MGLRVESVQDEHGAVREAQAAVRTQQEHRLAQTQQVRVLPVRSSAVMEHEFEIEKILNIYDIYDHFLIAIC